MEGKNFYKSNNRVLKYNGIFENSTNTYEGLTKIGRGLVMLFSVVQVCACLSALVHVCMCVYTRECAIYTHKIKLLCNKNIFK